MAGAMARRAANVPTGKPLISAVAGMPAVSRPTNSKPMMVTPSNSRSATNDDSALATPTLANRLIAMARSTSPARNGIRLLAMNPIAIPCHSGVGPMVLPSSL